MRDGCVKRLLKLSMTLLLAAAVLLTLAPVVLMLYVNSPHAARTVQRLVNDRISGTISWQSHHIGFPGGRVEVADAVLASASGDTIAAFDLLRADLSLSVLLRTRRLLFSSVVLRSPFFHLHFDSTGPPTIVEAFAPPTPSPSPSTSPRSGSPPDLAGRNLRIVDGTFRLSIPSAPFSLSAERIGLQGEGTLTPPYASADLGIEDIRAAIDTTHFGADSLGLHAVLRRDQLRDVFIRIVAGDLRLDAEAAVDSLYRVFLPRGEVRLEGNLASLSELLPARIPVEGTVRARLKASAPIDNPTAQLHASVLKGSFPGVAFDSVGLSLSLHDHVADLENLLMRRGPGSVYLEGTVDARRAFAVSRETRGPDFSTLSYDMAARLERFEPAHLFGGSAPVRGNLSGSLDIRGTGIDPRSARIRASASLRSPSFTASPEMKPYPLYLAMNAHLRDATVQLDSIALASHDARVRARGSFRIPGGRLSAEANLRVPEVKRFSPLWSMPELGGNLEADVAVDGRVPVPEVSVKLSAYPVHYEQYALDTLRLEIALDSTGTVHAPMVRARKKRSLLDVQGEATLLKPGAAGLRDSINLALTSNRIRLFLEEFTDSLRGRIEADVDIAGPPRYPSGSISIRAGDLVLGFQRIDTAAATLHSNGDTAYLDSLRVWPVPEASVYAEGRIATDSSYSFSLNSTKVPISALGPLKGVGGLGGFLVLDGETEGRLPQRRASLRARFSDLTYRDSELRDLSAEARLRDTSLHVNVSQQFRVDARLNTDSRRFSLESALDNVELAPYLAIGGLSTWNGRIAGTLSASGDLDSLPDTQAAIDLSTLRILIDSTVIIDAEAFAIEARHGTVRIPDIRFQVGRNGTLSIAGSGRRRGRLDLSADAKIPLGIATLLYPDIGDVAGTLSVSAEVGGSFSDPRPAARITLSDGAAVIPVLRQNLTNVNAAVTVEPGDLVLEQIEGSMDQGQFTITGDAALDGLKPRTISADLTASSLPVRIPETVDLVVDARLAFRGTPDASRLEGNVTLRDGLYYRDVNLDPLQAVTAAPRTPAEPAEADTVPFLSNVELDVDVNSRNELRVDNNLAKLRLRPDLSVSGTLDDPGLRGRASVTSGTVTYRRTTFNVTKGVVDFVDPYEIDPRLDIRAESTVRSWDIVLTIKGPLDKLKLSLSSKKDAPGTASLEQSDIISLLLTGRTTGELAEGGLGGQQSPRQMVAELVGTTVGDDLRRAAGLDILEITTGEEGDTTSSDRIGVTVGKRITRRLSTRLSMESEDNELLQKATVIYKLSERVQLKSFNTTRGEYGGEVEYQIEFR